MKTKDDLTVIFEGTLIKSPPEEKSKDISRWRKRYFRLFSNKTLAYYKDKKSKHCIKKPIDLNQCLSLDSKLVFKKWDYVFSVNTRSRVYYLVADSEYVMNQWLTKICDLCSFAEDPTSSTHNIVPVVVEKRPEPFREKQENAVESQQLPDRPSQDPPLPGEASEVRQASSYVLLGQKNQSDEVTRNDARTSDFNDMTQVDERRTCDYRAEGTGLCYDYVPPPKPSTESRLQCTQGVADSDSCDGSSACYDIVPPRQTVSSCQELQDVCQSPTTCIIKDSRHFTPIDSSSDVGPTHCYDVLPPLHNAQPLYDTPLRSTKNVEEVSPACTIPHRRTSGPSDIYDLPSCFKGTQASMATSLPSYLDDPHLPPGSEGKNIKGEVVEKCYDTLLPSAQPPPRPPKNSISSSIGGFSDTSRLSDASASSDEVSNSLYDVVPSPRSQVVPKSPSPYGERRYQTRTMARRQETKEQAQNNCYDVVPPPQPSPQSSPQPSPQYSPQYSPQSTRNSSVTEGGAVYSYDILPPKGGGNREISDSKSLLDPTLPPSDFRPHSDLGSYGTRDMDSQAIQYGLVPPVRSTKSRPKQQTLKRVQSVPVDSGGTLLGFSQRVAQKSPVVSDGYVEMGANQSSSNPYSNYDAVPPLRQTLSSDLDSSYNTVPAPIPTRQDDSYVLMAEPRTLKSMIGDKPLPPVPSLQTYLGIDKIPSVTPENSTVRELDEIYDKVPVRQKENSSDPIYLVNSSRHSTLAPLPSYENSDEEKLYDNLPPPSTKIVESDCLMPPRVDRTLKPSSPPETAQQFSREVIEPPPVNRGVKPLRLENDKQLSLPQEENSQTLGIRDSSPPDEVNLIYDTVPLRPYDGRGQQLTSNEEFSRNGSSKDPINDEPFYVNTDPEMRRNLVCYQGNAKVERKSSQKEKASYSPTANRKQPHHTLRYTDVYLSDCFISPKTAARTDPDSKCVYTAIDPDATKAVQEARLSLEI